MLASSMVGGALALRGGFSGYGILTADKPHIGEQISLEPARKGPDERARPFYAKSNVLRVSKREIAAPPGRKGGERTGNAERFRITWVEIAQRRFGSAQQEIARAKPIELEPNNQRLAREGFKIHASTHVDEQRLEVEVF